MLRATEIRKFAKALSSDGAVTASTHSGTVSRVDATGTAWVVLDGGSTATPCSTDMACSVGDRVTVRIADHRATVTGNATSPATDDSTALSAQSTADAAQGSADAAATAAASAKGAAAAAVAKANVASTTASQARALAQETQNHFWTDSAGVNITEQTQSAYASAKTGWRKVLKATGEMLTHAVNGVERIFRADTASGTLFFDGECAPDANDLDDHVLAAFTGDGVQVGKASGTHVCIDEASMDITDADARSVLLSGVIATMDSSITEVLELPGYSGGLLPQTGTTMTLRFRAVEGTVQVSCYSSETDTTYEMVEGEDFDVLYGALIDSLSPISLPEIMFNEYLVNGHITVTYKPADLYPRMLYGRFDKDTLYGPYSGTFGYHDTGYGSSNSSSFSLGYNNKADGLSSFAVGAKTEASGGGSSAMGYLTKATGGCAHAEGHESTAAGSCSHAEGYGSVASGYGAHAEGTYWTTSSGGYVAGVSIASGRGAHAEGCGTVAAGKAQHAQGRFNIEDSSSEYADIIGNGTSDSARSNCHATKWDGTQEVNGSTDLPIFKYSSLPAESSLPLKPCIVVLTSGAVYLAS